MADLILEPPGAGLALCVRPSSSGARSGASGCPTPSRAGCRRSGIVGAGLMATQLATLFVRRLEVPLVIRDLDQDVVDSAIADIDEELDDAAERGRMTKDKPVPRARSSTARPRSGFDGCDLVLEAVFEEMGVKQQVFGELARGRRARLHPRDEHVVALVDGDGRRPIERLVGCTSSTPSRCCRSSSSSARDDDRRRHRRDGLTRSRPTCRSAPCSSQDAPGFVVNRVLTRMTGVLMDALEHGNTVEETDEASSRSACRWRRRCCCRWSARASRTTCSRRCTTRTPTASRFRRRWRTTRRATTRSSSPGSSRVASRRSRDAVLEAIADEVRHMLDEGVVAEAADVDTVPILGAGWPFWMGGVTKYLDQTGVSERVAGRPLAEYAAAPA